MRPGLLKTEGVSPFAVLITGLIVLKELVNELSAFERAPLKVLSASVCSASCSVPYASVVETLFVTSAVLVCSAAMHLTQLAVPISVVQWLEAAAEAVCNEAEAVSSCDAMVCSCDSVVVSSVVLVAIVGVVVVKIVAELVGAIEKYASFSS